MKNKLGKMLIVLMMVITTVSMSACSTISKETASDICKALNEKYGEDFEVTQIGDRLNTAATTAYVHPVGDSSLIFTAKIDHSGNVVDDYVNNLVLNSIEKELVVQFGNSGIAVAANAVVPEEDVFETDKSLDANAFVEKNEIESILVRVIIDHTSESGASVISALEAATAKYNFDLVISLYFMNHDSFVLCDRDFNTYPSVGATHIENYSPLFIAKTVMSKGSSSVTADELQTIIG